MAASDRPSSQKSGIDIISGNAKVTGGEQAQVGSWAAPITDSGLGDLARGLGQFGQGANQLAAAFQARRKEQEDYTVRMAALAVTTSAEKRATELQEEYKQTDTDPNGYAQRATDGIQKEVMPAITFGREQLVKQKVSQKALNTYDLLTTNNTAGLVQRTNAAAIQHEQALWNQKTVELSRQAEQGLMTVAAAGKTETLLPQLGAYYATQQTMPGFDRLTPAQKTKLIAQTDSFAAQAVTTSVRMAMQLLPPEATLEDIEQEAQRQKDMLAKTAKVFNNSPQTYASLVAAVDAEVASVKSARAAQHKQEAGYAIDQAIATLETGELPADMERYLQYATPTERAKLTVLTAIQPQVNEFRRIVETGTPEDIAAAESAMRQVAQEADPSLRGIAIDETNAIIASAKSLRPENARARARASGATNVTLAAYNSLSQEGVPITEAISKAVDPVVMANLTNTLTTLDKDNKPPLAIMAATQAVRNELAPIAKQMGVPTSALLSAVLEKQPLKSGTRRVLRILPLIEGRSETAAGQAILSAAYEGGTVMGKDQVDHLNNAKKALASSTTYTEALSRYMTTATTLADEAETLDALQKTVLGLTTNYIGRGVSGDAAVKKAVTQVFEPLSKAADGSAYVRGDVWGSLNFKMTGNIRPQGKFTDSEWNGIFTNAALFNDISKKMLGREQLGGAETTKLQPFALPNGTGIFFKRVDKDTGLLVPVKDTQGTPISYTWDRLKTFAPAPKPVTTPTAKPVTKPTAKPSLQFRGMTPSGSASDKAAVDAYFKGLNNARK